jgi:ArsR family transcriptional regulator
MEELPVNPYPLSRETRAMLIAIKSKDGKAVSDIFKALADPARIKILEALGQRELCVCVLVDLTGLQYSALSYHLKQLKDVDLVTSDKDGNYLIYSLTAKGKTVQKLMQRLETAP